MKFFVVLFLCQSAAVAIRLGYQLNKRYTYHYEGVIVHGIPEALDNDLALRFTTTTHLDYLPSNYIIMRLENITLTMIKGEILDADRMFHNVKEATPLNEVQDHIKKCLEMPVRFKFKANVVEDEIYTSKEDPEWCLNIKRAIVNHFYLPINDNEERYQIRKDEVSVAGRCQADYTINCRNLNCRVKRVLDLMNCRLKQGKLWWTNIPYVDEFHQKRQGRGTSKYLPNFLRLSAFIDYVLKRDSGPDFLIHEVFSESEHDFTPLGDAYQSGKIVAARTRQKFTLVKKDQPIPTSAKDIKDEEKRGGLMFVYDDGSDVRKTDEAQKNIRTEVANHMSAIEEQLNKDFNASIAQMFTRLVSALRLCNQKSLEMVAQQCMDGENLELRKIFLDSLSLAGTDAAAVVIKKLLIEGKLKDYLERVLFGLGWVPCPSPQAVKLYVEICKDHNVASKSQAKGVCWLSIGNVLNRLTFHNGSCLELAQHTELMELTNIIAKFLREALVNATDHEDKILMLKAMGNMGLTIQDILKVVLAHVKNTTLALPVRLTAAWALGHMGIRKPEMVRPHLLPIFVDSLDDCEVRIACYRILLKVGPSLRTCQVISSVIAREAAGRGHCSGQLMSFIASDLRTSTNLDGVDVVRASRARLILRYLPRKIVHQLLKYSKSINDELNTGYKGTVQFRLQKVNVPQTFFPRSVITNVRLNGPGLSFNFLEAGVRMQGVDDILQGFFEPENSRQKRYFNILNFILGKSSQDEGSNKEQRFKEKLQPRFSTYFKLFGAEVYYDKLAMEDLRNVVRDVLFSGGRATKAGISFNKTDIGIRQKFLKAHLLSEVLYIMPSIIGIPVKISSKVAVVVKGDIEFNIHGVPKLITTQFQKYQASVKAKPNVAAHVHNKAGIWLPIFETGMIVRNQLLTAPRVHAIFDAGPGAFNFRFPTAQADQQILDIKSAAHGFMCRELTPGVRNWQGIDLGLRERGMMKINRTCYGKKNLGIAMCFETMTPYMAYVRTRRLPAFPYHFLRNLNLSLERGDDSPSTISLKFVALTDDEKEYKGRGVADASGKMKREIIFEAKCNKTKSTCVVHWNITGPTCEKSCTAQTDVDASVADVVSVRHNYGGNFVNSEIRFEEEATLMRIVNTWNKPPEYIHGFVRYHYPLMVSILSRYFHIEGVENEGDKCEALIKLVNRDLADISINAPNIKLRRINQELPFQLSNFPTNRMEIKAMLMSHYGTCHVEGDNYIKTTDNVVFQEQIPGTCPFVLAQDARGEHPEWKILWQLNSKEQRNVIVEIKGKRIQLYQNMTLMVNKQKVPTQTELKMPGVSIERIAGNKLHLKAEAGFQCMFDGSQVVVYFMPWRHNRIQGICGNVGEQRTDMITHYKSYVPATMSKEFLRAWMIEGKNCRDKQCKLQAKHIRLAVDGPPRKVCFTNGMFLRCVEKCTPLKKHTVTVAHHCVDENSPLIGKIMKGDKTVDLPKMSVDLMAAVHEHLTCQCKCT